MSISSKWPMNKPRQQKRSRPIASSAFLGDSPFSRRSLYSSQRWPTGLPQEKQRIGIIMVWYSSYIIILVLFIGMIFVV